MSIYVFDREFNLKKWYVYWIPKTKILGVKNGKDVVYEKMMTIQDRVQLLKCSKTLIEEKWSDLFAQCGLHIDEICEKELVLSFALQRNVTLERTELSGMFDDLLYLEYLRLKTLNNTSPLKRKRTASSVEHRTLEEDVNQLKSNIPDPIVKRSSRIRAKPNGPSFVYD